MKAYFVFLRYLVYLNLLHCLLIGGFILGPTALYGRSIDIGEFAVNMNKNKTNSLKTDRQYCSFPFWDFYRIFEVWWQRLGSGFLLRNGKKAFQLIFALCVLFWYLMYFTVVQTSPSVRRATWIAPRSSLVSTPPVLRSWAASAHRCSIWREFSASSSSASSWRSAGQGPSRFCGKRCSLSKSSRSPSHFF